MNQTKELDRLKSELTEWIKDIRHEQQSIYEYLTMMSNEHNKMLQHITRLKIQMHQMQIQLLQEQLKTSGGK